MKIFLDANILISVLNKEYPLFTYSARILSLADNPKFTLYTSSVCIAIAFYFAEKKYKSNSAKKRISILCEHIQIAETNKAIVLKALQDTLINDLEDGIEYYSAVQAKCDCIITEDTNDFYFSKIEVFTSESFFNQYLLPHK